MKMSIETGVASALIAKYGWLKLFTLCAALGGASMMAIFRPPKSKKEMFYQGAVALGCSLMFGDVLANMIDYWFDFINMATGPREEVIQFQVAVHGMLGAFSWGLYGGIAALRDKFGSDPVQAVKDVKSVL